MFQAEAKVQVDGDSQSASQSKVNTLAVNEPTAGAGLNVQAVANVRLAPRRKPNQPQFPAPRLTTNLDQKTRAPVIIGDVSFRGMIPVDGIVCGQPGANGGALSVRQRGRTSFGSDAELNGEIYFNDMLRVNGHIAGNVYSQKGTLLVDAAAQVDANVEVSIAVIGGTVNGDIVAHQRVELAPTAKIHGNIWTRSLEIRSGAIFEGICQMIGDKVDDK